MHNLTFSKARKSVFLFLYILATSYSHMISWWSSFWLWRDGISTVFNLHLYNSGWWIHSQVFISYLNFFFFWEPSVKFIGLLIYWIICFVVLNFYISLCILVLKLMSYCSSKDFSHSVHSLFTWMIISFAVQTLPNFI